MTKREWKRRSLVSEARLDRKRKGKSAAPPLWRQLISHWTDGATGTTRLHYAVKEGYDAAVHYFIKKGDPLDLKDKDGNTALHYATDYGHTRLVKILLQAGARWDEENNQGETAAAIAWKILKTQISTISSSEWWRHGASKFHPEPLLELFKGVKEGQAMRKEKSEFIRFAVEPYGEFFLSKLIGANYDPEILNTGPESLLMLCIDRASHHSTVQTLLRLGADPNRPGDKGDVPLVRAVERRLRYSVEALLEYGANPNVQCAYPSLACQMLTKMPIPPNGHSYSSYHELCIVELLLSRGADVFFRDENQRTLLHCLVQKEGNSGAVIDKRIIELLLKKGVDIDAVDVNGESALFIAIRNPFMTHTIDTLLSKGSNARLINQKGQSPLVYAVDTDCCRITPSLIRMSDLSYRDDLSRTVLHISAIKGKLGFVNEFASYIRNSTLKHNQGSKSDAQRNTLEINARDKFGCTALHYAVSVGNVHIVRDLVRAKADPAITNNEGDTPLMIALKDGEAEKLEAAGPLVGDNFSDQNQLRSDPDLRERVVQLEKLKFGRRSQWRYRQDLNRWETRQWAWTKAELIQYDDIVDLSPCLQSHHGVDSGNSGWGNSGRGGGGGGWAGGGGGGDSGGGGGGGGGDSGGGGGGCD